MLTRRDFIKTTAASAALVSLGLVPAGCDTNSDKTSSNKFKGVCRYCGTGCGVIVTVDDGKVVEVKGDPDCDVNKGKLCLKAEKLPDVFTSPKRVEKPLVRKNGVLTEVSWEEALDTVAKKFKDVLNTKGPDGLGYYGSGQNVAEEAYLANKLYKGCLKTNNIDGNPRTCMASAVAGFISTYGKDEPMGTYADIEEADVFFIIGANMAEAHPILFERIRDRKRVNPSIQVIVLDPRKTQTASIADELIQFVPGTDLALLNSIAYVLIQEDLIDEEFIGAHTTFIRTVEGENNTLTFDEYKTFLEDYAPEKVADKTGIAAAKITEIAKIFGEKGKKTMSLWTMGLNQRSFGTWLNNLMHNLHLLTGKICSPGNTPFSLTGQPSACGSIREVGALSHLLPGGRLVANEDHRKAIAEIWGVPVENINPKNGLHTINLFKACATGDVEALWVICTNPGQSLPNLNDHRKGMEKVFLVVSESFHPTRTSELADVVFPSAFWMEKEGVYGNGERRTQHIAKAIDPPGEAKPDVWQIVEIAKRMGFEKEFAHYVKDGEVNNEAVWEEYRKCGKGGYMELASYADLKEAHGLVWPVNDKNPKGTKIRYGGDDPYVTDPGYKGVQFYARPDKKAVIYARPQSGPKETTTDEYPFYLSTGRVLEHWHTNTMTGESEALVRVFPESYLEMNPKDAEDLDIADGGLVKITSQRGTCTMKARFKGAKGEPQQGMVFAAFHDRDEARMINLVTIDEVDGTSAQPEYKICAVKIEKA
ncbi:MAG: molybdopterin-dependent oxidoreductase [Peptococcaceae bacterium]|nr:molybdopterin-dependent oxidoreductase [Peptococcaceae bacterium]